MRKIIAVFLLSCVIWSVAAPAYAGSVPKEPLTDSEDAALALQQTQDADDVAEVAGGDGVIVALAVVGVVFLVLYFTGNIG